MRSSLIYLVLVGLPLVALIGVMKVGERIVPPTHVGGVWRVASDSTSDCRPSSRLEIMQSGIVLDLQIADVHAKARMKGDTIRSSPVTLSNGCAGRWLIEARVTTAERLTGEWIPLACDSCPPVAFTAERVAGTETEEH